LVTADMEVLTAITLGEDARLEGRLPLLSA